MVRGMTLQTFESISKIIASGATCLAAGVAIWGIRRWRSEHLGKRRLDLAEQVLALGYRGAEIIEDIVSGLEWDSERANQGDAGTPRPDESPEQAAGRSRANVVFARYRSSNTVFVELHSLRFRVKALFGEDAHDAIERLLAVHRSILVHARCLGHAHEKVRESADETLNEEVPAKAVAAVRELERVFLPYLTGSRPSSHDSDEPNP
jgi:hypothetical protein